MNQSINQLHIWKKTLKGDLVALEQLYMLYHPDLYQYALKITNQPDLAEDATQDVFVDLWNYRQQLGTIHSPKFYLIRSVRNQCLKLLKKQNRLTNIMSANNLDLKVLPTELQLADNSQQVKNAIEQAMNSLTPRQREIIYLKFYNNLDYEELAQILDINYQSVVNHIHKAMLKLRNADVLQYFKY